MLDIGKTTKEQLEAQKKSDEAMKAAANQSANSVAIAQQVKKDNDAEFNSQLDEYKKLDEQLHLTGTKGSKALRYITASNRNPADYGIVVNGSSTQTQPSTPTTPPQQPVNAPTEGGRAVGDLAKEAVKEKVPYPKVGRDADGKLVYLNNGDGKPETEQPAGDAPQAKLKVNIFSRQPKAPKEPDELPSKVPGDTTQQNDNAKTQETDEEKPVKLPVNEEEEDKIRKQSPVQTPTVPKVPLTPEQKFRDGAKNIAPKETTVDTSNIKGVDINWDSLKQRYIDEYEEKERKKANTRAKIQAIGDALRGIGNLYFTTKGASPQNIDYSASQKTIDNYNAEKEEREEKRIAAEKTAYERAKDRIEREDKQNKLLWDVEKWQKEYEQKERKIKNDYDIAMQNAKSKEEEREATQNYRMARLKIDEEKLKLQELKAKMKGGSGHGGSGHGGGRGGESSNDGKPGEHRFKSAVYGQMSYKKEPTGTEVEMMWSDMKSKGYVKSEKAYGINVIGDPEGSKAKKLATMLGIAAKGGEAGEYISNVLHEDYGFSIDTEKGKKHYQNHINNVRLGISGRNGASKKKLKQYQQKVALKKKGAVTNKDGIPVKNKAK